MSSLYMGVVEKLLKYPLMGRVYWGEIIDLTVLQVPRHARRFQLTVYP